MKRAYILAVSYSDRSGILRAFGPYATEAAAKAAEPELQALYESDGTGLWEIVPMYEITIGETS